MSHLSHFYLPTTKWRWARGKGEGGGEGHRTSRLKPVLLSLLALIYIYKQLLISVTSSLAKDLNTLGKAWSVKTRDNQGRHLLWLKWSLRNPLYITTQHVLLLVCVSFYCTFFSKFGGISPKNQKSIKTKEFKNSQISFRDANNTRCLSS